MHAIYGAETRNACLELKINQDSGSMERIYILSVVYNSYSYMRAAGKEQVKSSRIELNVHPPASR
jgi:hypothetical protein